MRSSGVYFPILVIIFFLPASGAAFSQEPPDALAAYHNGRYQEAVQICFTELEVMPRNMNSYTVLGWSLIALERYQEAAEYGERAHDIAPRDYRIIEILGEAHYFLGNNLEALDYFEEYVVIVPTGDRIETVYYYMGEILIRLGEFHRADIALSTAVYHAPNRSTWWARLGYAREQAQDYQFAYEAYEKALSLNPGLNEARRGRERALSVMEEG